MTSASQPIEGTILFNGDQAMKGYALNKMFYSFNDADNRAAFAADEPAYARRFEVTASQIEALALRDVLRLLDEGANIYYLAKFAGILGLDVQDVGALQTGMSKDDFIAKLKAAGGRDG